MKYYKLYSCCLITEGVYKSVIIDTQKGRIFDVPNSLLEIFNENGIIDVDSLHSKYNKNEMDIIFDYIDFLLDNDFVYSTNKIDEFKHFPNISSSIEHAYDIQDIIIDVNEYTKYDVKNIYKKFKKIKINHAKFRFYFSPKFKIIDQFIWALNDKILNSISILIEYDHNIINELKKVLDKYPSIVNITIYNCPKNDMVFQSSNFNDPKFKLIFMFSSIKISDSTSCGQISVNTFRADYDFITMSKLVNNCLNSKISIDVNGNIKNCPSFNTSYGHISNADILKILNRKDFKKMESIKKDDISICSRCEYRYVCSDCRAYIDDENNLYSKPKKCNYDPFTGKWK